MSGREDALRVICERSDMIWLDGVAYLLTPVTPDLMDDLAAVGTETSEDEDNGDLEPDHDADPSED